MALTKAMAHQWRRANGEWLYHCALAQAIPWIKRDGLLPRYVTGVRPNHGDLPSRANRVYLMTNDSEDERGLAGVGQPNIRVHFSMLDPGLFGSDEDVISAHSSDHNAVAHLPGANGLVWPTKGADVAAWAENNADVIDQPDWVWFSAERGRISYAGLIPTSAFEIYADVSEHWDTADVGVPFVPTRWVDGAMPYERRRR